MTARSEILSRVRAASARSAAAPDANLPRPYLQESTLDSNACIDLFEDRLRDYDVTVYRCSEQELPQTILHATALRGKKSLIVSNDLAKSHLPDSIDFHPDNGLTYDELDCSEGVLTRCALAIATTGTIVLRHTQDEGRRALTLIPDYHLCVVYAGQIVETVVEGVRAMGKFAAVSLTTISGPSATSDIEMIRIEGVHGPRVLDVIIVM